MNHLQSEKSPYLLQHVENPVDWYPWGTAAFEKAVSEDKPVFLSIGYSTCHWCHVMAHESFEDTQVASLLNRDFVPIKVDREERPDVDAVYMSGLPGSDRLGRMAAHRYYDAWAKAFFCGYLFSKIPPLRPARAAGYTESNIAPLERGPGTASSGWGTNFGGPYTGKPLYREEAG